MPTAYKQATKTVEKSLLLINSVKKFLSRLFRFRVKEGGESECRMRGHKIYYILALTYILPIHPPSFSLESVEGKVLCETS